MKFSIGDKMRIKRSGEEGFVVSILDHTMVEVQVGNTVFPIYLDEIEHPYFHWFTQKNKEAKKKVLKEQLPVEKAIEKKALAANGFHLVFMPEYELVAMEDRIVRFKIFAANQTHYTVKLSYSSRLNEQLLFQHQTILQPFSDIYLHYLEWEAMAAIPKFEWILTEQVNANLAVEKNSFKIKSSKLFEHINTLQQQNLPSFSYKLIDDFNPKPIEKEHFALPSLVPQSKRVIRSVQDIPKYELDLHIEQLLDNYQGLSNAEILHIQLTALEKYLQLAIKHQQERLVIIHGNGKGVLRSEVNKKLLSYVYIDRIESGWQAGYGFGATLVYFKY